MGYVLEVYFLFRGLKFLKIKEKRVGRDCPSDGEGRNNANLSHMHRSGFVFRWIIGLPRRSAGQPTFSASSPTMELFVRPLFDIFVRKPQRTSLPFALNGHDFLPSNGSLMVNTNGSVQLHESIKVKCTNEIKINRSS